MSESTSQEGDAAPAAADNLNVNDSADEIVQSSMPAEGKDSFGETSSLIKHDDPLKEIVTESLAEGPADDQGLPVPAGEGEPEKVQESVEDENSGLQGETSQESETNETEARTDTERPVLRSTTLVYASAPFDPEDFKYRVRNPSRCIGVFGFGTRTDSPFEVYQVLKKYGPIEGVDFVKDAKSGKFRGYGFVHFERIEDARRVVEEADTKGLIVGKLRVRVDFSKSNANGPRKKNLAKRINRRGEEEHGDERKSKRQRSQGRDRRSERDDSQPSSSGLPKIEPLLASRKPQVPSPQQMVPPQMFYSSAPPPSYYPPQQMPQIASYAPPPGYGLPQQTVASSQQRFVGQYPPPPSQFQDYRSQYVQPMPQQQPPSWADRPVHANVHPIQQQSAPVAQSHWMMYNSQAPQQQASHQQPVPNIYSPSASSQQNAPSWQSVAPQQMQQQQQQVPYTMQQQPFGGQMSMQPSYTGQAPIGSTYQQPQMPLNYGAPVQQPGPSSYVNQQPHGQASQQPSAQQPSGHRSYPPPVQYTL